MRTIIFIGIVALFSATTAYGAVKLIRGEDIAQVGIGSDLVTISKFVDGDTTCYVSRSGKSGSHDISCVK